MSERHSLGCFLLNLAKWLLCLPFGLGIAGGKANVKEAEHGA